MLFIGNKGTKHGMLAVECSVGGLCLQILALEPAMMCEAFMC